MISEGTAIRDLYPDYVEAGSVYEFLADAYAAKGDKDDSAQASWSNTAKSAAADPHVKQLATLEEEAGEPRKPPPTLDRLNYIYPEDEELHKRLGDLWLAQNNVPGRDSRISGGARAEAARSGGRRIIELARRCARPTAWMRRATKCCWLSKPRPDFKPAQKLLFEICEIIKHVHSNHSHRRFRGTQGTDRPFPEGSATASCAKSAR